MRPARRWAGDRSVSSCRSRLEDRPGGMTFEPQTSQMHWKADLFPPLRLCPGHGAAFLGCGYPAPLQARLIGSHSSWSHLRLPGGNHSQPDGINRIVREGIT